MERGSALGQTLRRAPLAEIPLVGLAALPSCCCRRNGTARNRYRDRIAASGGGEVAFYYALVLVILFWANLVVRNYFIFSSEFA